MAVYIPDGDTAYFAGPASVFSNFKNKGILITEDNPFYFFGTYWENEPASALPGNGTFYFSRQGKQELEGGYRYPEGNGPSFPNLSVDNPDGVYLAGRHDLHIRRHLHFMEGHLILNGREIIAGDSITGYTEKHFIVTGPEIEGGHLYRTSGQPGQLIFPIGTAKESYSPLAVRLSGHIPGYIGARVFDHVYEKAVTGGQLDSMRVTKTWQLATPVTPDQAVVFLQHAREDEGVAFSALRDSSYVSFYDGRSAAWDEGSLEKGILAGGIFSTGVPVTGAYVNRRSVSRSAPDTVRWFSVAAGDGRAGCPVLHFNRWLADRYNYKWVQLFWRTQYEMNVDRYELQVRQDTAVHFHTIESVRSKSSVEVGDHLLYYYFSDENTYEGISYYRLKIISPDGCISYSSEKEVNPGFEISVWPNPVSDHLNIKVFVLARQLLLQLINNNGQIAASRSIAGGGTLDVSGLPDGTYYLVVLDPENGSKRLKVIKVIIQHRY